MSISIMHDKPPQHTAGGTIAFDAEVDGEPVTCEISDEALKDHFGGNLDDPESLLAAFEQGRRDIELLALMKLNIDPSSKCMLHTRDFKE